MVPEETIISYIIVTCGSVFSNYAIYDQLLLSYEVFGPNVDNHFAYLY